MAGGYDRVDRALQTHKRRSRWMSAAIVALGLIALALAAWYSPDRRRQRNAARLPSRSDSAAVLQALGPSPTRCPPGTLEHLRGELPIVDAMEADSAMLQLRRDTRQRWIYPGRHGCTAARGETELGLDTAGRLLWIEPAAGKDYVRLSPKVTW
jgi:hypothetical protein